MYIALITAEGQYVSCHLAFCISFLVNFLFRCVHLLFSLYMSSSYSTDNIYIENIAPLIFLYLHDLRKYAQREQLII